MECKQDSTAICIGVRKFYLERVRLNCLNSLPLSNATSSLITFAVPQLEGNQPLYGLVQPEVYQDKG